MLCLCHADARARARPQSHASTRCVNVTCVAPAPRRQRQGQRRGCANAVLAQPLPLVPALLYISNVYYRSNKRGSANDGWRCGSLRRMLVECRKVGAIEASDVGALPITPMSVIDGHGTDIGYRFTIEASDDGALPNVRLHCRWRMRAVVISRAVSCRRLLSFVPALLYISNVMLHCPRDQR